MRFFHMAFAVTIACATAAAVGAAQYRAWGVRRPSTPVSRSSFNQAESVSMAGRAAAYNVGATGGCDCDGGPVAYGGDACGPDCGCDDCCGSPCDPWCGSGPCLLPNLVGGIIREVGCGLHWLFCCPLCGGAHYDLRDVGGCGCGDGCGDGCGGGAYYGTGCDSGCTDCDGGGVGTIEANLPDLMPTPTPPVQKQANPFKDDTASVYPRRSYRPTRRPTARRAAARQPSVIRSTYAAPLPSAAAPNTVPRNRPRVKKAAILQSLKAAIQ